MPHKIVSESQNLEAIIRLLGVAELRMKKGAHIGLSLSLLFGNPTSRVLRSWYWHPVWLELDGKNFQQMWTTCNRGDWLLWFCTHMIGHPGWPTHQQVVLASCQCARLALRYIKPAQERPLNAIETAEEWARGKATTAQVREAGRAADYLDYNNTSYSAAQAAHSAAWAVYAEEDGVCFRLAQAVSGAASWVASAAKHEVFTAQLNASGITPADRATQDNVEKATLRQCADLVRQLLKVPESLTNEFSVLQQHIKQPTLGPTEKERLWQKGCKALERGKELYLQNEVQQALHYFDIAINSGFEGADVYGMRGGCLQSLKFDLDAIDDFTRAIEFDSEDSNNYFMRSISKGVVGNLQGRVDDLEEAIRLASIDSPSTRSYDAHAREKGYKDGVVDIYRMEMIRANLDVEQQASDGLKPQDPSASLRRDLVTKRRSQARRREPL